MNFKEYQFKEYINQGLQDIGFFKPTEIQSKIIPLVLKNKNIIGKSATGTGKTHAFLIPILQKLDENLNKVQAVIISPTRELAMQLYTELQRIARFNSKINAKLYVGGSNRDAELSKLEKQQPQIVVATIGKLKDLAVDTNVLKIYTTTMVVIDEADMVFEASEIEDVDYIFSKFEEAVQILTFSATIPQELITFLNKYINRCEVVDITNKKISKSTIEHIFIPTKNKDKNQLLLQLFDSFHPYLALIFANTKIKVDEIAEFLGKNGIKLLKLTGDLDARERKQVLKRIKDGQVQFVVASDIASRGIDIPGVSHIINYELPNDIQFYIHRTGRTARYNFDGQAISFYDYEDDHYLNKLKAKGLECHFKNLVDGQLVNTSIRNYRGNKEVLAVEESLHKKIPVPKKIKPGYKKKRNEKIQKELRKLKRKRIDEIYKKRGKKK